MDSVLSAFATKASVLIKRRPYLAAATSIYVATFTFYILRRQRRSRISTKLRGPSWKDANGWGSSGTVVPKSDSDKSESSLEPPYDPYHDTFTDFEDWADQYGLVYNYPVGFFERISVVCDPRAISHIMAKDTIIYHQHAIIATSFEADLGKVLLVTEGDDHKRQRRALSAGFSVAQIRNLMPIFHEFTYAVKQFWDSWIDLDEGETLVDIQSWVNSIALDVIGKGGFAHTFGATSGYSCEIFDILESFGAQKPTRGEVFLFIFTKIFPSLVRMPTDRRKKMQRLAKKFEELAVILLDKARKEKSTGINEGVDKSIIGALLRSETGSSNIRMDLEEIKAQINILMLAGYETTGIALTWALIELSRNPHVQDKLREELSQLGDEDASFDQLNSGLPYLDAVVCETLRLNPSLQEVTRTAQADDVLPLNEPIKDASGKLVNELIVSKGDTFHIPIIAVNRSKHFWGEDAHKFNPDRWIDDSVSSEKAVDIAGYRHMLTFGDGTRACLGRLFALTEIKSVLSILIRNYTFELPHRPEETFFTYHIGLLIRPKVAGKPNANIPLRIRRVNT